MFRLLTGKCGSPALQTCRLCCFENNCIDPTPGSKVRVSVMKDLLLNSGFRDESIDTHLAHENEIAFNRGVTTTTAPTTTTTTSTTTTPASTTPSVVDLCTSTPVSEPVTDFVVEEVTDENSYDSSTAEEEEEKTADSSSREVMQNKPDENEEEQIGEYLNSPAEYSEARVKTTRGRLADSQEMQMNDQTYNEETTTRVVADALWDSSRGAAVRGGASVASTLLITLVAAVEAARSAV